MSLLIPSSPTLQGLGELGLIRFIGDTMVEVITRVPVASQMLVSLVVIVWVSAIASSLIDNIPFTTAMIPVIVDLANSRSVCLQLRPLVWALALGACLGGEITEMYLAGYLTITIWNNYIL